jgi:hypothetical protein
MKSIAEKMPKTHTEFTLNYDDEPEFSATISFTIIKDKKVINRILDNFKKEVIKQIESFIK